MFTYLNCLYFLKHYCTVGNGYVFSLWVSECEDKGDNSGRLVACITTLYLFSKIRPQLMVKHAMTMQPYLTTKCNVMTASSCLILLYSSLVLKNNKSCLKAVDHRTEMNVTFFLLCNNSTSWWQMKTDFTKLFFQLDFDHSDISLSFQTQNDFMVICNVARILELVLPLMENPSENFVTTLEEDLMKLIIKYGMTVSLIYNDQPSEMLSKILHNHSSEHTVS